ncbi:MAG TPA: SRPBCC domain-containing protein [Dongiaceae bacterium]|nr:SRPBCC domain-containing protein [Dongiaceae bacterium]
MPGSAERATCVTRHIAAPAAEIYAAFMDPAALVDWLPPGEMTGKMHHFDGEVGGGYRMSLYYPASEKPTSEKKARGKTTADEDMVDVRFIELRPPHRIVEAVVFASSDPALRGEMTVEIDIVAAAGGAEVSFLCRDLPPGLRLADNETGSAQSLDQLARYLAQQGT